MERFEVGHLIIGMIPRAFPSGRAMRRGEGTRGFTLLEICIVLLILAILAGVALPSINSAFTEQALRGDAQQISLMIKTGMLQSNDQGRIYTIELTPTTVTLSPSGDSSADDAAAAAAPTNADTPTDQAAPDPPINESITLDPGNKIFLPDPEKPGAWVELTDKTQLLLRPTWLFKPGELCPIPRFRIERGAASIEMSFNALTGNVVDETLNVP